MLSAVQREVRAIAPEITVDDVRTGTKVIDQALWTRKMAVAMLGIFGILALALASIGLYGVMAYPVNRRQREIGVRMALGAAQPNVHGLVLRQRMTVVSIGIAVGLAASLLIGHALSKFSYGVSTTDPLSRAASSLVLIAVALLACYMPARKASRIDPIVALRGN